MIIETFEHIMPESIERDTVEKWINEVARLNMTKAGDKMIRWCWMEAAEKPQTLISLGEHASTESIKKVWQTEEMLATRN